MGERPEYMPPGIAESIENAGDIVKKYANKAIEYARDNIRKRFEEETDNPENNLEYHRRDHTDAVLRRVDAILNTLKASLKEMALGKVAGAFHDTVQNWVETPDANTGVPKRKRFIGDNEKASAEEASAFMNETNKDGIDVFSADDIKQVVEAIMVTVPGFNGKTVIQPGLQKDSPLVVLTIALADLGAAGMDGAEQYLKEGDENFREENIDIARAIENGQSITSDQAETFKQRMIGWTKFQPIFATGRQEMLEQEIAGLTSEQQDAIRSLFNKFPESIKAATDRIAPRENMTFPELAKDMGYAKEPVMAE